MYLQCVSQLDLLPSSFLLTPFRHTDTHMSKGCSCVDMSMRWKGHQHEPYLIVHRDESIETNERTATLATLLVMGYAN